MQRLAEPHGRRDAVYNRTIEAPCQLIGQVGHTSTAENDRGNVIFPEGTRMAPGKRGRYHVGGAWLAAIPPNTTRQYLYHVTAAGQWTRLPVPTFKGAIGTEISGFTAIPGTSSVYAYGSAVQSGFLWMISASVVIAIIAPLMPFSTAVLMTGSGSRTPASDMSQNSPFRTS